MIDLREGRDRERAEEALPASEQNFRLIVESIPGFVCTTTAAGEIEFVNQRILDYLGKTLEESKDWRRTLLHEEDCERVINSWSHSVATGEPYDIEHRVRRFDGVFRWFHVRGLPLREADGRIIRWYVLLTDIDKRKRTEATLQESEERFRRMADAIPEVIWFTALDPEKVLYVSPSFERIWGLPVNKLYKKPRLWIEAIHPDDRQRVTTTFQRWIAGEQVSYHNIEYRIVQTGGAIRSIHERGVLTLNHDGKPQLASGIS